MWEGDKMTNEVPDIPLPEEEEAVEEPEGEPFGLEPEPQSEEEE